MVLSYSVPMALPVSQRRDLASISGRVHELDSGAGVAGVILRLGGAVAVSDASGNFAFPAVAVGLQYLAMDALGGPFGRIALVPMPLALQVGGATQGPVDIALVRSAALRGTLTVAADAGKLGKGDDEGAPLAVLAAGGLRNVLLTFEQGATVYKRLTDEHGAFGLGGIAPGQWTMSVDAASLPAGFELDDRQRLIELAPGAESAVVLTLRPKRRAIRLQQLQPVRS